MKASARYEIDSFLQDAFVVPKGQFSQFVVKI
jgi:hypothetical protein